MPSFEEISPRPLDPRLLQLSGISRASVEAHYRLYQGYVGKRNEILAALQGVDLEKANQVYSELRALKVDLTFAIGGIKNHELYFAHLGGPGGDPDGAFRGLVDRDFGSVDAWRSDLKATGIAGRGWAWTAFDWDEQRLFNYIGDAQNTFPVWNATPLVALDVYEHAYFLDYQTDRGSYIDAFFENLDWDVVNVWRVYGRSLGVPVALLDVAKGFVPAALGLWLGGDWVGVLAGAAAMIGHARPLFLGFSKGGKMVATAGGVAFALAPLAAACCLVLWLVTFAAFRYASVSSMLAAVALPVLCYAFGASWPIVGFTSVAALGVLALHRQNVRRLLAGTEPRFTRAAAR